MNKATGKLGRALSTTLHGGLSIATLAVALTVGCQPASSTSPDSIKVASSEGSRAETASATDSLIPEANSAAKKDSAAKEKPTQKKPTKAELPDWAQAMLAKARLNRQHLVKNQTLLVAIAPDELRTKTLAFSLLPYFTDDQRQQCHEIIATYKDDYDALLNRRDAILDHIGGNIDIERELFAWRISVASLSRDVRQRIHQEVLTQAQKIEYRKQFPVKETP